MLRIRLLLHTFHLNCSKTIDNLRGGITRSAFCRMAISDFCTVIQENGIIDKDTIEERNQIVYSSDPIISSWVSIEILTTIDNLRGKRSRSEFFRMAVNEFCEAIIEIGSTSCNSGKSPNLDPITKPKKTGLLVAVLPVVLALIFIRQTPWMRRDDLGIIFEFSHYAWPDVFPRRMGCFYGEHGSSWGYT